MWDISFPTELKSARQREKMEIQRIEVLGIPVDVVNEQACLEKVDDSIQRSESCSIVAVNPEKVMHAREDAELLNALRDATVLIPDGIGIVVASRILGLPRMSRVAGSDLMPLLCSHAAHKGYRIYIYGASLEANRKAVANLRRSYPGLEIVGHHHGYVKDADVGQLTEEIRRSRADILFVGLGSPRQELWVRRHMPATEVPVCQCVGGTIDVLAGHVKRAPVLWQRFGLEWLYRLVKQPSRIVRQKVLFVFFARLMQERIVRSYQRVIRRA